MMLVGIEGVHHLRHIGTESFRIELWSIGLFRLPAARWGGSRCQIFPPTSYMHVLFRLPTPKKKSCLDYTIIKK